MYIPISKINTEPDNRQSKTASLLQITYRNWVKNACIVSTLGWAKGSKVQIVLHSTKLKTKEYKTG